MRRSCDRHQRRGRRQGDVVIRCGLSRSAIVIAVVVASASSGCELTPDPNKHAPVAATGSNPAPPPSPVAPPPSPGAPPDAGPPPDASAPLDASSDGGLASAEPPVKPPVDAKLEGRVLARCVAQSSWPGYAFFHTQRTPFSVMIGTPNHWVWVGRSSPNDHFPQQLAVPLNSLVRATGVAGLTPSIQVLIVSGHATDQDAVQSAEDDALNRVIYDHQHARPGTFEIVHVAHDDKAEGTPVIFAATPSCTIRRPGTRVTDHCPTPQCPR
jgi:hypothetical protein